VIYWDGQGGIGVKLRHIGRGLLLLPLILVVLVVLYEAVGMAVNHIAGARQTERAAELLETELPWAEVLDSYTETGNTSGTGNHVDMLSAVIFRTDAGLPEIERLIDRSYGLDEWSCWVEEMAEIAASREERPYAFPCLENMEVPEELEHVYLLYMNRSAPFPDNIEGH